MGEWLAEYTNIGGRWVCDWESTLILVGYVCVWLGEYTNIGGRWVWLGEYTNIGGR